MARARFGTDGVRGVANDELTAELALAIGRAVRYAVRSMSEALEESRSRREAAAAEWEALWAPIRARGVAGAEVFCHRDYHAENLVWLPGRPGIRKVGMLDFQDALRAHPAWDLSMLLHDGRRDVSPERESASLERYLAARPGVDRDQFLADYRGLGALNSARILFIFARQVASFKRPRYAAFMPRMWRYLDRCLEAPELAPLKAWFARNVVREPQL